MKNKFKDFMNNRYGGDLLNAILSYLALGIGLVNLFKRNEIMSFVSLSLVCIVIFRAFSKNKQKRALEQVKFFNLISPIYSRLLKFKNQDRKNFIYFKCKNCKADLRIPKGKGNIRVICPNCKYEEMKRS